MSVTDMPIAIGNAAGDNADKSNKVANVLNKVTWQKTGLSMDSLLNGSEWKIQKRIPWFCEGHDSCSNWTDMYYTPATDTSQAFWDTTGNSTNSTMTVTDCVADDKTKCKGPDKDPNAGKFSIEGLPLHPSFTDGYKGEYRLVETKAPEGYATPKLPEETSYEKNGDTDGVYYRFTIRQPNADETEIFVSLTKSKAVKDHMFISNERDQVNIICNNAFAVQLPLTGGMGLSDNWLILGGILGGIGLLLAGVTDMWLRRRPLW